MRKSITLSLLLGKVWIHAFISSPEPSFGQTEAAVTIDSQLGLPSSPSFPPQTSVGNALLCADLS